MIVYFSGATGFTHRFVEKLEMPSRRIPLKPRVDGELIVDEEFVLITPTYESRTQGYLPRQTAAFLNNPDNRSKLVGVIGSGNTNFNEEYTKAADVIHEKTGVPLLYRFELAGTEEDVEKVTEGLAEFWRTRQYQN